MKSFATAAALVSLLPAVLAQNLMVNSPANVVQCEPTQLTWTGGSPPYYLSLIPAGQPSAPAIKEFPTQQGNSYTWMVDLQQGTSFTIEVKDSTGTPAYSSIETINPSSDSSCLNSTVSESGGSSGPTASAASSGSQTASIASTTAPAASGSNTASGSSAKATGSNSAQSASSSGSTKSNGAGRGSSVGSFGVAGLMGLLGAALF